MENPTNNETQDLTNAETPSVEANVETPAVAAETATPIAAAEASATEAPAIEPSTSGAPVVETQAAVAEALAEEAPAAAQQDIAAQGDSASEETAPTEAATAETPAQPEAPRKAFSMEQVMESDEFSSYMSGVDTLQRGALMRGVVVRVDENTGETLVDIGSKSEGIIGKNEVGDEPVSIGDEIEVVVLRPEDDDGHPVVSKRRADYEKVWRVVQQAKDKQTNIEGLVREQVKGGLIVDLGVPTFVPASHVDARHRGDLSRYIGRTIPVRVIEIDRKRGKVIASHRLAVQEDREKREAEVWSTLQKDQVIEGVVRRITEFGAFIDLGGIDGLLHVREMGWTRVEHPEDVVKKGQKLQVLILEIDEERKRVALGLKQLQSDPWKQAAKNYRPGQTVKGKVVRLAPTVAFVELEAGVEGILPVGEISETRINEPGDVLTIGQEVEARIKQIQSGQRRITLSLKAEVREREVRETRTAVREVNQRAMSSGGGSGGNSGGNSGGGNSGGGNSGGGNDDGGALRLGDLFGQQLRAARDRGKERNEARSEARERAKRMAETEEDDFEEVEIEEIETDDTEV